MEATSAHDTTAPTSEVDDVRRDPVGWTMWSIATIIAIAALFMASIALGR
jgi:hypothetical protein